MKPIYHELMERVENGEKFHIDFEKRNMKVGKTYLIKDGEYDTTRKLYVESMADPHNLESILNTIENMYHVYKHSTPSERSENKRRKYFKAKPVEEMTDFELVAGVPRECSQAAIEGYILCHIIDGSLYWDEQLMGKWFYQGNDPDLIILKKWIEK